MNVSVAIATYNGEKYIEKQLKSIVSQLDVSDEVIVSDDGSTDDTIRIVEKFCSEFQNIKVVVGPQKGIVRNFMNAIAYCKNDIIVFSDQDDIWCDSKIKETKDFFEKNPKVKVLLHNAELMKENELIKERLLKYRKGFFINLIKSCYWGCCMASKREFLDKYFDEYSDGIAHDQIIGLLGEKLNVCAYMDKTLIYHRIHANNKTKSLSVIQKIMFRINVYNDFKKYYNKGKAK